MAVSHSSFSSPMAKIVVDGNKVIGWATGVTGSERIVNQQVKVLGSIYAQEIVPVDYTATVSVDLIHIKEQSISTIFYPQGSSQKIVQSAPFTLDIYDQYADKIRWRAHGCKVSGRTLPLGRGGISARNVQIDVIRIEEVD